MIFSLALSADKRTASCLNFLKTGRGTPDCCGDERADSNKARSSVKKNVLQTAFSLGSL